MSNEARQFSNVTVRWTASGTTSDICGGASGFSIVGIAFPSSGFAGTKVSLQTSVDGINFGALNYSPGDGTSTAVSIPKVAGGCVGIDPVKTLACQSLKLVSDATEAANTTIKLICAPYSV